MVADLRQRALEAVAAVVDPEIPVLTIADLGVLRTVEIDAAGTVEVAITPTYSGCPAMAAIAHDVARALADAGIPGARVRTVLAPAWSSDWITQEGRRKLHAYGIAPPERGTPPVCPQCGSADTELLSTFGSTLCKALWRCRACREPFDHFRCH